MTVDEAARIARSVAYARTPLPVGAVGPGDDAAVLPLPAGVDLVVTTDLVSESVHFFAAAPPQQVGAFAATVNLSDLAAMGAEAAGLVVAYGVPRDDDPAWGDGVAAGLAGALDRHACPLLGGDTKEAGCRTITGTALGVVPHGRALLRSGARPGDALVLTGMVGGPAAALRLHEEGSLGAGATMEVVLGVAPRLRQGVVLRTEGASACVDLSDGVARAACLLAGASGVAVRLQADALPLAPLAADVAPAGWADSPDGRRLVVGTGGEYELLAAVPAARLDAVLGALAATGVAASRVGMVTAGAGAALHTAHAEVPLDKLGWSHFSGDARLDA